MSILSSSGPDTRETYFSAACGEQVQRRVGCPRYPHGHGFMAATSITEHGYVSVPATRDIVILPSSIG